MPPPAEPLIRQRSLIVASWLFMIALALAGCDGPSATGPPKPGPEAGPAPCVPGELTREDGTCQKAGLPPDMPCPPGESRLDDGITCQKAGVPPSACGAGFVPDGKEGCEPILPADPCPEGLIAIPGDTACHEVAPCGSGTWGDIPVEANTQFVDKAYAGGNSDGTQAKPWTTIQQGIVSAANGAIVAVAAGSYPEDVLIEGKAVRLWGRCPAMVEVAGTGAALGAILVLEKAAGGAEIHGVAVTGPTFGVGVSGASDVVIEGVWVHDAGFAGVDIQDDLGPTSAMLKGSLLEQSHNVGVLIVGSEVTIEATAVRSTQPGAQGYGHGIEAYDALATKARANVVVRGCLVEQSHDMGVYVGGSDATIEATVVRSTLPDAQGAFGRGINIVAGPETKARAAVTIRASVVEQNRDLGVSVAASDVTFEAVVVRSTLTDGLGEGGRGINIQSDAKIMISASLVEQNHDAGVFVDGSDLTIEATVVRSTQPNGLGELGRGINIQNNLVTGRRSSVTVRACVIEQNHEFGVYIAASDATIEAAVIRSNLPSASGEHGGGIAIEHDVATKARANVTVRACLVEQNHELGIVVAASDATIEGTEIRSTLSNAQGTAGIGVAILNLPGAEARAKVTVRACLIEQNDELGVLVSGSDAIIENAVIRDNLPNTLGQFGNGIAVQMDNATQARADAIIRACLIAQNRTVGVFVGQSDATIEATVVRDTAPQSSDNAFGDGITVYKAMVSLQDVDVAGNARAGVSSFGGKVVVTGGVIVCNSLDVEGEPFDNIPFSYDGSTGWQCSADAPAACTELGACHVETTGIAAPLELPSVDPLPQ